MAREVKGNPLWSRRKNESLIRYSPALYAALSVVFAALFAINICTHDRALDIFAGGGLAALTAYRSCAARSSRKGRNDVS